MTEKKLSKQRKKQLDYKARGLCILCGQPRCEMSVNYCFEHFEKRRVIERRKYHKRKQKLSSPTN